jgi:hypothetical protein
MANCCSNRVEFTTNDKDKLTALQTLFEEMAAKEKATEHGQLPPFSKGDKDWLFQIQWDGDILYYETKWSPSVEVIQEIAEHYGVGFRFDYSETGNGIYGQYTYENGVLIDTCLENEDFEQYSNNEETDDYTFEGETYEADYDILEILLERKKQNANTKI